MDNQNTLQTVDRAISFLEFVAAAAEPPSIREVSKGLNLNITTCYHLLRTLVARDYIKRGADGQLELGESVGILFRSYQRSLDTEEYLAGVVKRIASQTLETSFLSLRDGKNVILKVLIEGTHRLRVAGLFVGLQGHEYRRAAGKAVLAHVDETTRSDILEACLANTPERQRKTIYKTLEKELPQIVARGWSVDDQTEEGIISIGAPIFDASGTVIGAVGIVTPTFRMDKSRDSFINAVLAGAAEATQLLKNISDK
ncbi:IclR family transcriptional regulator [Kordiimonas pumila]|uniref:IclR family transcriptional regulator n=1 Tax=Kordiimonas pumila TaxID=2161677 RepID=A0ABV7D9V1_9PROT|nr:IclR family transcriptional regulator [Kordiimonas pumila]